MFLENIYAVNVTWFLMCYVIGENTLQCWGQ